MAAALGFGGVVALARPGGAPAADDSDARLQRLVVRLGSQQFREREAAYRELDALGEVALGALRHAARDGDPETCRRAADLAERISRRLAASRLLAATPVALNYEKTPLADAVADLARRTGAPITLHADPARIAGRTVTITASEMPFWHALRLFCHWAGLREWDGQSQLPSAVTAPADRGSSAPLAAAGIRVLGQMTVRRGRLSALTVTDPPVRVALLDGPSATLPTYYAGAMRVRCLPPGTPFPADAGKDLLFPLQVSAEPRLNVTGALDLRIERAIDDRGRALPATPIRVDPPSDDEDWVRQPNGRWVSLPPVSRSCPVGVRVARDGRPVKLLRELAGVLTVQTFPTVPVVTVARPAEAIDKTIKGEGGVSLKVAAVTHLGGNELQVVTEQQLPYGVQVAHPVGGLVGTQGWNNGGFRPWGGVQYEDAELTHAGGTDYQGLALEDARGRRLAAVNGAAEITGLSAQGFTLRLTATFRHEARGEAPARLVFAMRRPTVVEVPFVLRDVPLP
jgi:hypothetical protein